MTIDKRSGRDPAVEDITPEMIDHYVRVGKRLRSQAIAAASRRLFSWSRRNPQMQEQPENPVVAPEADASTVMHRLVSALTAIRSSGELLRDDLSLSAADRARFADIVVKEEARLESLLSQLFRTGAQDLRSHAP